MPRRPLVVLMILAALSLIAAGCGGDDDDGGSGGGEAVTNPEEVSMTDFAFDPDNIALDGEATLTLTNDGEIVHNMAILEGDDPLSGDDPVTESEDIEAGESGGIEVGDLEAGDYSFLCTIPGHAEDGMTGTMTVE